MFDRFTIQTLATKLDAKAITLKEAKEWVKRTYGKDIPGRTKDQFIRNASKQVADQSQKETAAEIFAQGVRSAGYKV